MPNSGMACQQAPGSQQSLDTSQLPSQPQALPGQMGTQPEEQELPDTPIDQLRAMVESVNIAEKLDDQKLHTIGADALEGYLQDVESRRAWELAMEEWTKLATQVREEKTYPWPKSSNVKYPLPIYVLHLGIPPSEPSPIQELFVP